MLERTIHGDLQIRIGAFDGVEIAAVIVGRWRETGPGREVVGDANLLYGRNIRHANVEMAGTQRPGFDVVFDVLGQAGEENWKFDVPGWGCMGSGSHFKVLS